MAHHCLKCQNRAVLKLITIRQLIRLEVFPIGNFIPYVTILFNTAFKSFYRKMRVLLRTSTSSKAIVRILNYIHFQWGGTVKDCCYNRNSESTDTPRTGKIRFVSSRNTEFILRRCSVNILFNEFA